MAKPKIMIVEDDPFSVQLLRHNLKHYNAEILPVANTAEEALRVLGEHEPDVVLLDIYLSGEQDGLEVARAINENFDIPIIYLTGYSSEDIFEQAKLTDPFGYLLKPFTPKELTVTLDMALYKHGMSKQLKESKALLAATLESLSEAVLTTDETMKILYANPVAATWFGACEGKSIHEVLKLSLPQTKTPVKFDTELFDGKHNTTCQLEKLGGAVWARLVASPTQKGKGFVVVLRDVSAEYEGGKAAQSVFEALESLEEGMLLLDPANDRVLFASRGFEKLTGWTSQETVNESINFLFGAHSTPGFWGNAKEILGKNGYHKAETIICTRAGKERLFEFQFTRMTTADGADTRQIIVQTRDVTDFRQVEEDFRQSQKIEAVGRLAGGVAHDFNNLLSVINSYSDLLNLKLPEGDPLNKYVNNIRTAGQRAADLVAKLLTFSRRDSAKPMLLDVKTVTDDIYKMLRRVIRENIEITLEYGDTLGALWADQLQLEQLLMNLCVNARDAISDGGSIKVAWHGVALAGEKAQAMKLADGNYLTLTVSDTGCGMDEKVLAKIFEPYFTTKEKGKGTGLGLSIVFAIVKQLKGHIDLTSRVGEGTTFKLYLPASERPAMTHAQTIVVEQPTHGNEHILIVEDEESFADCLQGVLSLHGYQVHYARDAMSALEQCENALYPIKLLISDMVLPNMSGQDMALKLKEKNPDLKVIFITGYDNALQILKDFPHTALVLQKPFSVVSILNKIRDVLDTPQDDKKIQLL